MTDTNEEEILNLEYILSTDKTTTKRSHGSLLGITFLRVVDDVFFFNRQNRLNSSNRILNNKKLSCLLHLELNNSLALFI